MNPWKYFAKKDILVNIFVLARDPKVAATMLCDKHVVKMIVESAQMLSTVAHKNGYVPPYRATHANHPCTLWVGESKSNWDWLVTHSLEMCLEYTRRYNKIHKTQAVIQWCIDNQVGPTKDIGLTPFRLAMPSQYKSKDAVESYRNYYIGEKSRFAKWKTGEPSWWIN